MATVSDQKGQKPGAKLNAKKSARERAFEQLDVRAELDRLESMLGELKIQYEQHFLGIRQLAPDELHRQVKFQMRKLLKAPFKTSAMNFRLRAIESKYNTFYSYWSRVNRQREDGTYARDVFKAEMHEKALAEEARAQTAVGAAERGMGQIFNSYKDALEQTTGRKHEIDFDAFQRSLIARAKDIKEKHGVKKVSFKVKVHEGKVTVQAVGKNE